MGVGHPVRAFRPVDSNGNRARPAVPVASLALIVLQGTASVDVGGVTLSLKAPPGPAELTWNSLTGTRPQPLKREKLPDWANPELPPIAAATTIATAAEKFRKLPAPTRVKPLRRSSLPAIPLSNEWHWCRSARWTISKPWASRLFRPSRSINRTLRHGFAALARSIAKARIGATTSSSPPLAVTRKAQAEAILQLLFGFSAEDLARPETYAVLIDYLVHEKPAIRNLAAWHLIRLVPQGKAIALQAGWHASRCGGELCRMEKAHPQR